MTRVSEINDRMSASDFWNDQERARMQMDELRKLKAIVGPLQKLSRSGDDLQVQFFTGKCFAYTGTKNCMC